MASAAWNRMAVFPPYIKKFECFRIIYFAFMLVRLNWRLHFPSQEYFKISQPFLKLIDRTNKLSKWINQETMPKAGIEPPAATMLEYCHRFTPKPPRLDAFRFYFKWKILTIPPHEAERERYRKKCLKKKIARRDVK